MKLLQNTGNIIILGFIITALSMIGLALKATQVKFDMATMGDYYQEEVLFNEQLLAKQAANELGNDFNFNVEGNKLTLKLPNYISKAITKGKVQFYCLSNSINDSQQGLDASSDGIYIFDKSKVAKGNNYIVKVSFSANGKDFYKEFKYL